MTGELFGTNGFMALILVVVWSILAFRMGRLVSSHRLKRLRRRARTVLALLGVGLLLMAAKIYISLNTWPAGWWPVYNKMILHVPLLIVPAFAVIAFTVPRLWRIARTPIEDPQKTMDAASRCRASEPLLVVPIQAAMWGTIALFYFFFFTAVPLRTSSALIPLAVLIAIVIVLWLRQGRHWLEASRADELQPRWQVRFARASVFLLIILVGFSTWITVAVKASRIPDEMSMMSGVMDFGGGPVPSSGSMHDGMMHGSVSVTDLVGPQTGVPDRRFTLTAEKKKMKLSFGAVVDAWTFNGQLPGPELRVRQGDLVEVTLVNKDIEDGVTLHWHGLDVPNGEDGVPGVTQNAVMPGQTFTYRFRAEQAGTYWYHSHQQAYIQEANGLFGSLIIEPKAAKTSDAADITVVAHEWQTSDGRQVFAFGTSDKLERRAVPTGKQVRLRLINTTNDLMIFHLTGTSFKVAAIDGTDVNEPSNLQNASLPLAAGGRYDVTFTMPSNPVLLSAKGNHGDSVGLLMSTDGKGEAPKVVSGPLFDPASYGHPASMPFNLQTKFDRRFTMVLGDKLGFYDGAFTFSYTINGKLFPHTPMFMVQKGDRVETTFINRSNANHPMHLHGHHMLVLSRNGKPVSGSPWWVDTLNVGPGETYQVAFLANNPGIWMDHCHNLKHAAVGMMMHLAYIGVTSPFKTGHLTGNHPE